VLKTKTKEKLSDKTCNYRSAKYWSSFQSIISWNFSQFSSQSISQILVNLSVKYLSK